MINSGQILGRVYKLDNRTLASGKSVSNVVIVTSTRFVKDGEKQEKTMWHNVVLFGKLSEIVSKYVVEGDLLYVQGEMESQKYTGKDGQERQKFVVIGEKIKLIPNTRDTKKESYEKPVSNTLQDDPFIDDQLPF